MGRTPEHIQPASLYILLGKLTTVCSFQYMGVFVKFVSSIWPTRPYEPLHVRKEDPAELRETYSKPNVPSERLVCLAFVSRF